MLVRYGKKKNGAPEKIAEIYTIKEHRISRNDIDPEAVSIIRRLNSHGYKAYVVGGAVRDLLIGKEPKDYDIATDAVPSRIRHIFKNSRIIGRRFPLVHVFFHDKIIEVSTFRADSENTIGSHGTPERDAWTRDFTINAFFYDPEKEQIIDYVGAMRDLQDKIINPLLSLDTIFADDPVRMIRAVKYGVMTGFSLSKNLKNLLSKQAELLASCSSSRLTEELFKILASGYANPIIERFDAHGLLDKLMPVYGGMLSDSKAGVSGGLRAGVFESLGVLDRAVAEGKPVSRSIMIYHLVNIPSLTFVDWKQEREALYRDCFYKIKELVKPLTPPNAEIEGAVRTMFAERRLQPLHRRFWAKR